MDRAFFTEKLKIAFNEGLKTRAEIAETIGVSKRTIDYWCSGRSLPDIEQLHKISQITKRSIQWFYDLYTMEDSEQQKLESVINLLRATIKIRQDTSKKQDKEHQKEIEKLEKRLEQTELMVHDIIQKQNSKS